MHPFTNQPPIHRSFLPHLRVWESQIEGLKASPEEAEGEAEAEAA